MKTSNINSIKQVPLGRWLSASYVRTAIIPLCLIELGFLLSYWATGNFTYHRNVETVTKVSQQYLGDIANREALNIEATLGSVEGLTHLLAMETREALDTPASPSASEMARYRMNRDGVFSTVRGNLDSTAGFYSGLVPIGPDQIDKVKRTARLDHTMRHIKAASPLVRQVYFNSWDSYNRIYPYFDVRKQYAPKMNIPSYNFYYEADARHNPARKVVWTDAYVDPAGGGWMVSAVAPVYGAGRLDGVVGIDLTVETILQRILALNLPWQGYAMLVGRNGAILALPKAGERDMGIRELKDHAYHEAIKGDTFKPDQFNIGRRPELTVLAKALGSGKAQVIRVNLHGHEMMAATARVVGPGWSLVVMAPATNIMADANSLHDLLRNVGLGMLAVLLAFYAGFFAFLLWRAKAMSRRVAEPLRAIEAVMGQIGAGEYDQQAPQFGVTEIDNVAHRLVDMGGKLGAAYGQIVEQEHAVRDALDNEKRVTTGQRRFINMLSHEFRTPLSVIDSCGQILRRRAARITEAAAIERSDMIRRATARIDDVMNSALQLVQLEEGAVRCEPSLVPLDGLLRDVLNTAAHGRADLDMVDLVLPEAVQLHVDRALVHSALAAIIDNARKYSPEGGRISVEARIAGNTCKIVIQDNGPGIPAAELPLICDRFYRGSNSTAVPGAGTGLYLSCTFIKANAGTLDIQSAPGTGTTVVVTLPLNETTIAAGDLPEAA